MDATESSEGRVWKVSGQRLALRSYERDHCACSSVERIWEEGEKENRKRLIVKVPVEAFLDLFRKKYEGEGGKRRKLETATT